MCNKCFSLIRVPNQLVGWVKDKCESAAIFFLLLFQFIVLLEEDYDFFFFFFASNETLPFSVYLAQINLHTHSTAELIS